MKLKVTFEVDDLPDTIPEVIAREFISDAIMGYAGQQHLMAAAKWCAKAKVGTPEENKNSTEYKLYEYHKNWGERLSKTTFEISEA